MLDDRIIGLLFQLIVYSFLFFNVFTYALEGFGLYYPPYVITSILIYMIGRDPT